MYRENHPGRLSFSSFVSSWSNPADDGILSAKQHRRSCDERPAMPGAMERSRQSSTSSERSSCEGMTVDETKELWRCMLELQQRYGCYNSTRIDMALDAGDDGMDYMPSRFIIDTLNESVIYLPDEGRELLNRHLSPASCIEKQKWKFWKKE